VKKLKLNAMAIILVLAMVATVIFVAPVLAEQVDVYEDNELVKSVVFKIGVPEYVVNDQTPGVKMDVAPFIQSGRTFVPVRFLGNALGLDDGKITWDNGAQTATLKGANATLQMTIGQAKVVSNGAAKAIDAAPVLQSSRTFLPARYVAEGLGYEVGWDEATQTVVCWPAGQAKPDVSVAVEYLNGLAQDYQQPVEQPAQTTAQVQYGGYVIPDNTDLTFGYDTTSPKGIIDFWIQLKKGDLQQQYADAKSIMLQTVDAGTVEEVMNYAMQAGVRDNDNRLPPIKTFNSSNGMAVRVIGGDNTVQIMIWPWPTN
jgi:hypothetical protein